MVVLLAFLLVNVKPFRRLLFHQTIPAKLQLFVITIVSNLTGIEIDRQNHLQSTIILTNARVLADKKLPYFRSRLNFESAQEVAQIIKRYTNFDAISLTTRKEILAHVGAGNDHHLPTKKMVTHLSEKAIESGQVQIAQSFWPVPL